MTGPERVASLMRLGYTECQARFLLLAALHGGYFLTRQYKAFSKSGHGRSTATFLRAVLSRNHAIGGRISSHAYVYHVTAGALFTALGDPGNRNARVRELGSIRRRLIGLDFVLSRLDWTFLATEREQRAYFLLEQHVPHAALPFPQHASSNHPLQTIPWNAPKGDPVAVAPDGSAIALAYRDDGDRTYAGFARFLRRYAPLCERLSIPVEIVFVTAADNQLQLAERAFKKTFEPRANPPNPDDFPGDAMAYVRAHRRCEQEDWDGRAALRDSLSAPLTLAHNSRVRLLVHRVPFDYRPLGMWRGEC